MQHTSLHYLYNLWNVVKCGKELKKVEKKIYKKKKQCHREKWKKKKFGQKKIWVKIKIWVKKKFDKKKFSYKKNLGKKNWPKKGHYPKRGTTWPKLVFPVCQVDIPVNHVYSPNLKPNRWKLLHLWPIALSGTQNCPFPIGPFGAKNRNLGPYHLLDIITNEKPAKFQIKWTTASKVMRHRNFCAPKRVSRPKGAQIGPKLVFLVLQGEIPRNHVYNPNFKWNGWKLLYLGPTALSGTQNSPIPIGRFSDRNCKFAHCNILDIIKLHKPSKLQVY